MTNYIKTLFALALLVIGFAVGYAFGERKVAELKKQYAEAAQTAEQQAREKEKTMQQEHDSLLAEHEKYRKNAETEIHNLRRRVLSGDVRLSVPAATNTVPGNPGIGADKARCELDPKTADDLIGIAADGDTAVRELNLCIDMYNAVRK